MRRRIALGFGALIVLTACCPIPLTREVSELPDLTVEVVDAAGTPVPGAQITVRRITVGPPPSIETHRWTTATGPDGTAHLDAIETHETYFPLMMHGVEWYGWEACAEHQGQSAVGRHGGRTPVEPPVSIPLTLDPAQPACAWEQLPTSL